MRKFVAILGLVLWAAGLHAGPTQEILDHYAQAARLEDPDFDGFSADRGEKLYHEKGIIRGLGFVSCASCHLPDPRELIIAHQSKILCRACHVINDEEHPNPKKAKVRKIQPLAPSANMKRLTDPQTVEDFLRVNCTLVFKRECTAKEKGDVLVWLGGIK
ncbi:MAG: DUF1924 domain-containing protein [Betaproteobacteria bacterium]